MDTHAIQEAFSAVQNLQDLEVVYESLCGKQGSITQQNKTLGGLSPEEKKVK